MKYIYILIAFLLIQGQSFSQGIGSLGFINDLGEKKVATYGDALTFFVLILEKTPGRFNNNKAVIGREITSIQKITLQSNDPLKRGAVALLIADYLKLSDSLMYTIFKNQTYAVQACIAEDIMDPNCSSNDILSGEELIEIMNRVSEYKGGGE